jgi:hypothetical protein
MAGSTDCLSLFFFRIPDQPLHFNLSVRGLCTPPPFRSRNSCKRFLKHLWFSSIHEVSAVFSPFWWVLGQSPTAHGTYVTGPSSAFPVRCSEEIRLPAAGALRVPDLWPLNQWIGFFSENTGNHRFSHWDHGDFPLHQSIDENNANVNSCFNKVRETGSCGKANMVRSRTYGSLRSV